jgi:hypothetical protein
MGKTIYSREKVLITEYFNCKSLRQRLKPIFAEKVRGECSRRKFADNVRGESSRIMFAEKALAAWSSGNVSVCGVMVVRSNPPGLPRVVAFIFEKFLQRMFT